jgi:hypothetical protein
MSFQTPLWAGEGPEDGTVNEGGRSDSEGLQR